LDQILKTAREAFGFDALRPGQGEAIQAVVGGRDTLAVLSTGSGKSAIYQIAGLLLDGPTLVISPLIALQLDQVENITEHLPGEAAEVNSTKGEGARRETLEDLDEGDLEFLFLAPEQLGRPETLDRLRAAEPSLLVVDEAHCISEWGHDFRPDYLRLGALVEELGHPVTLALTATASPPVREEIVERLGMRDPAIVVRGFDRANLHLRVERFHAEERKLEALIERVAGAPKPGIVYAATRRLAEEIAEKLDGRGVAAVPYHAGLRGKLRDELQERFMDDEVEVIVATTAFGMGVDKANVRFVFHHDVPESIDSYYQQIGRGGRDGAPAEAVLFYRPEDVGRQRFFAGGALEYDELERVARAVGLARGPVGPDALAETLDLPESKLSTALNRLEEAGAVRLRADGDVARPPGAPGSEDAAHAAARAEEARHQFDRSRVEMMRAYAEHETCRRAFLLSYFGEEHPGRCGNCDNCAAGRFDPAPQADGRPWEIGARVTHGRWGGGTVQRYEPDQIVVLFDEVGYKTLALELVSEHGLLHDA